MNICDHRDHVVNTRVAEVLQQGSVFVVNSNISLVYLVETTEYYGHNSSDENDGNKQTGFTLALASH